MNFTLLISRALIKFLLSLITSNTLKFDFRRILLVFVSTFLQLQDDLSVFIRLYRITFEINGFHESILICLLIKYSSTAIVKQQNCLICYNLIFPKTLYNVLLTFHLLLSLIILQIRGTHLSSSFSDYCFSFASIYLNFCIFFVSLPAEVPTLNIQPLELAFRAPNMFLQICLLHMSLSTQFTLFR